MYLRFLIVIAVAGAALFVFGCESCEDEDGTCPANTFAYTGYLDGIPAVVGWFTMHEVMPGEYVEGEWHFAYAGEPVDVGPQIGYGVLEGWIDGDRLDINLNPQLADHNVYLSGHMVGNQYTGQWVFATFSGTVREGEFEALRK